MIDKREQILLRLEEILTAIDDAPAEHVYRDRGVVPDEQRPVMVLLDGAETVRTRFPSRRGMPLRTAPSLVVLVPQIFALLRLRKLSEHTELGPELSQYRVAMKAAIEYDEQLVTLVGPNGDIEYRGCDTDMQTGSTMEGQLQLNYAFHYVLDPTDLV